MKTLIITTSANNKLNPNVANVLSAANKINANICDVIIIGNNLSDIATQIAKYSIVNNVFILQDTKLDKILAENISEQLANIIKNYTHVLVAADAFGKNLLPRIAGILDIGQISEIVDVVSPNIFKRFMYAGNVQVEIESFEDIKLLTVRTINFPSFESGQTVTANISEISFINPTNQNVQVINENIIDKSVDLGSAKVVVSGGRSLGSKDAFDEYIRILAGKLHAAVGATRAAVDAGFAPNDCQVGQTGKIVAPQVYLAIGVSGAVQHIAGMKDSQTVIAINTDQTAPIFEHADYGLIADLFETVPQIVSKI